MSVNLAIVGIFYDGYYDLWEDFLELFQKNWSDCPYPLYIVDSEKELSFEKQYNVSVLNAGKDAEYSKKVQLAINQIDADYLLLLLEDFFVSKPVDSLEFQRLFNIIQQKNYSYYAIPSQEFCSGAKRKRSVEPEYNYIRMFDHKDEYTVSCQPAIWKKEFLAECIGTENYNAWIFEGVYIYSSKAHTDEFLEKLRIDYRNILNLRHGAVQGKLLPNVYSDIVDTGYSFKTNREILDDKLFQKHLRKQKLKSIIPNGFQKLIKKIIPVNSVTEKYKDQIFETMKKMNLK